MLSKKAALTIPIDTALSNAMGIANLQPSELHMPSAWTTADITVQVSEDGSTWLNLYAQDGDEVTVKADASQAIVLDLGTIVGAEYIRLRSGTLATPVEQAAERTLTLTCIER